MIKNKRFKHIVTIFIFIAIFLIIFFCCIEINSKNGFRFTILNTSNEKMVVELFICQGNEEENTFKVLPKTLEQNESHTFFLKFDKSYNIFKILVEAINYSWYYGREFNGIKQVDAHSFYYFPDGEIYDLLAVIDISGDQIIVTKMPDSEKSYNLYF